MPSFTSSTPTHLSIFVTDPDTGRPVADLPLYAEVAVPRIAPIPPIHNWFRQPIRAFLITFAPTTPIAVRDQVETAVLQTLSQTIEEASLKQLSAQGQTQVTESRISQRLI